MAKGYLQKTRNCQFCLDSSIICEPIYDFTFRMCITDNKNYTQVTQWGLNRSIIHGVLKRVTLFPNSEHLDPFVDQRFMKTDRKCEIGKVMQILGHVVITLMAEVPGSACVYDASNKGHPQIHS